MKRFLYILLICLLAGASVSGQRRVVQWLGTQLVKNDSVTYQRSQAGNTAFLQRTTLPYLVEKIKTSNKRQHIRLTEVEYTELTDFEREQLNGQTLPTEPQISTTVVRDGSKLYEKVLIDPYVEHDGRPMKLASYRIETSDTDEAVVTDISYADHSVLRTGKWIKIRVTASGLHQLTYSALRGMGLNPATTRIHGYGGGMLPQEFTKPKPDDLPQVTAYDTGNALVFYAQGPVRWDYNSNNGRFEHTQNPYSVCGYYFLTDGTDESPARCSINETRQLSTIAGVEQINTFTDHLVYENDQVNILALDNRPGGREMYQEGIANGGKLTISFDTPDLIDTLRSYAVIDAAANCSRFSSASITIGTTKGNVSFVKNESVIRVGESGRTLMSIMAPKGNKLTAELTYNSPTDNGRFYLNYIELHPQRALKKGNGPLMFNNSYHIFNIAPGTRGFVYQIAGVSSQGLIFDITDPLAMSAFRVQTGQHTFGDEARLKCYVAVEPSDLNALPAPEHVGTVENQDVHSISDVDMLIVTNKLFLRQANQLAQAHEEYDGLKTAVVTDEQVYNEFASGNADATAIRWLCKKLHETSATRPLRYLLLLGDGTFDNRQILKNYGNNFIVTYEGANSLYEPMAYAMDDYFGFTKTGDGTQDTLGELTIGVGRLPANTAQEAQQMVDKTIAYMTSSNYGDWRKQVVFLADDGDANFMHTWQADSVASQFSKNSPQFTLNKIYLEAYQQEIFAAGERYPIAKNKLDNFFNKGMLVFNYTGHGSSLAITNEQLLLHTEARDMTSANLALWVLATCSFSHYDTRDKCIAEYSLINPNGAAVAVFSATRTVFAAQNLEMNNQMMKQLFIKTDGEWPRIGDAIVRAKNDITLDKDKRDYDAGNRLAYSLLGDPAVKLKYPHPYAIEITAINEATPSLQDTLKALQEVTVKGRVMNEGGNTVSEFNGEVDVALYDKEANVRMLNNDGMEIDDRAKKTFKDRNSTLFKGKADVVNGEFEIDLMIPKDIHYNYGTGRLEMYANDTTAQADALGYEENFIIGGSSKNIEGDEQGPDLDIYLNTTAFRNGGKVNETPLFLAFVEDDHGINTAGSGIGHDLMLTVDADAKQTYNLNDYFSTAGNYKSGTVQYLMPQMTPGRHTLTFRVWDLFNNSTTKTLDFVVVKNMSPQLLQVLVYPNPVPSGESINIAITHDRPNTTLHTVITVFDLQGRKLWQQTQNGGERLELQIPAGNFTSGVYIYRLEAKTSNSDTSTKVGQFIVR
ncbi:MAG: type IX secretion system sortase PorU [Paludibacteraceae bacterium]|nr:type IX secretion system sortase PorU [Paludibacteraceae bacterium]